MKALNFSIIKLTLYFMCGVICGFYFVVPISTICLLLGIFFSFFSVAYFIARNRPYHGLYFGVGCLFLSFLLGMFTTNIHSPKNNPQHYLHKVSQENFEEGNPVLRGKIVKILNPSSYSSKYILSLERMNRQKTEGRILVNISTDSSEKFLTIDDRIVLKTPLVLIPKPLNPHQFDYHTFMKHREVYRQVHVRPEEILLLPKTGSSYSGGAENLRKRIVSSLKKNGFSPDQVAMIQALLLGQTRDITDETYDAYAAAGVIHILSVSGLHVGFVLLLLHFIFKPLEWIRYGKYLKIILLLLLLWGFALLAGFSSPVVRSVTMFSFVAIGLNWERKTNILNILFLSLFAILLVAPQFIFEVGFQLSYLAVFSIVIFQPVIFKLYRPRSWIIRAGWGTLTVTLAAQIGILPLSLYYFHQFPGIFFLSNLLVVPYVGFLLAVGILVILLAMLRILPHFLVDFFGNCIDLLNIFVTWCAHRESFLFQGISFSEWELWAGYLFVFCLVLLLRKFTYKYLMVSLASLAILLGVFLMEKHQQLSAQKFVVFHKMAKTMVGFKNGTRFILYHNLFAPIISKEYRVKNFMVGEGIAKISGDSLKNIYRVHGKRLLIIDSLGIYQLPKLQHCLVLLRNSPQINLERMVKFLHPTKIIVDGSNYYSYVDQWRKTCHEFQVPFHYTGKKGAFITISKSD